MGSPYFVHMQAERVHVVRSRLGFLKILEIVCNTMCTPMPDRNDLWYSITYYTEQNPGKGPEAVVLNDLLACEESCEKEQSRKVLFLEARYEWRGWEKFQRVIVFDFTVKKQRKATLNLLDWEGEPFSITVS